MSIYKSLQKKLHRALVGVPCEITKHHITNPSWSSNFCQRRAQVIAGHWKAKFKLFHATTQDLLVKHDVLLTNGSIKGDWEESGDRSHLRDRTTTELEIEKQTGLQDPEMGPLSCPKEWEAALKNWLYWASRGMRVGVSQAGARQVRDGGISQWPPGSSGLIERKE